MTGYIKVEESYVESLIKNAAWDAARVSLVEAAEKKIDAMKEDVKEHTCPLCETILDEALTDEQIYEHVAQIHKALQTIEEADDEDEDAALADYEKTKGSQAADAEVAAAGGGQGEADAKADMSIDASKKSKNKKAAKAGK